MFASVDSRSVDKVWLDERLIFDRARGDDPSSLGLQSYGTGAEDCGTGFGDGCSNGAQEAGIKGA